MVLMVPGVVAHCSVVLMVPGVIAHCSVVWMVPGLVAHWSVDGSWSLLLMVPFFFCSLAYCSWFLVCCVDVLVVLMVLLVCCVDGSRHVLIPVV